MLFSTTVIIKVVADSVEDLFNVKYKLKTEIINWNKKWKQKTKNKIQVSPENESVTTRFSTLF